MCVITISRGTCSGGELLAEYLARKLGYRCISRDQLLDKAAAQGGVSEDYLRQALESAPASATELKRARSIYLIVLQAALLEEVKNGRAIYHGLAGHILLKEVPHVLRVRLIAPMDVRVAIMQDRMKLPRKEAIAHIQKKDQDRRKWTRFLYGVDWEHPSNYDVVLNLDHLNLDQACDFVYSMLQESSFQTTAEHRRIMQDLATAARIRASLALDPATTDAAVEVQAHGGVVSIQGKIACREQGREIARIARAVRGVNEVQIAGLATAAGA
jgi:cytidylate kinase